MTTSDESPNSDEANTGEPALLRRDLITALGGSAALLALGEGTAMANDDPKSDRWVAAAKQFLLDPNLVYFNCGSLAPSPRVVVEAHEAAIRRLETNPVEQGFGPMVKAADEVRERAAALLGCQPAELALTRNTTEGMNLVAEGLDLARGSRVLMTDQEHGGGRGCWEYLAARRGIVIDKVELPLPPKNAAEIVELFRQATRPETRVISVSHVTYVGGVRMPIAEIGELAKACNCMLIVDGAQAAGAIDVDIKSLGCHAYAASGHKWLMGPKGTGLLYIRADVAERLSPAMLSRGMNVYTATTGTRELPAQIGLGAALTWAADFGPGALPARLMQLRNELYVGLSQFKRLTILSPSPGDPLASPIIATSAPDGVAPYAFLETLYNKHRVVVKVLDDHPPTRLRFTCHVHNTSRDIDRLLAALATEL